MFEAKLYLFNAYERGVFMGMMDVIEAERRKTQEANQGNAEPGQRVVEETKPARKSRKAAVAAVVAGTDPIATAAVAVANPEPTPIEAAIAAAPVLEVSTIVPEVSTPAAVAHAKVWSQIELEAAVRSMAKTNFAGAKGLLDVYKVARFSLLPAEKYQEFGDALAALAAK